MKALFAFLILTLPLAADIVQTTEIKEVENHIEDETLIFFNIGEVLTDSPISLGSQKWRHYVRSRLEPALHDALTHLVFKKISPITPEEETAPLLQRLQESGKPVFGLTARGRAQWYSTATPDVDLLTESKLGELGIDFSKTTLPQGWDYLNSAFTEYYSNGILYTANGLNKGDLLANVLLETGFWPQKIVVVDDKIEDLESIQEALKGIADFRGDIPFTGIAYGRTTQNHPNFDPLIAHIQLEFLLTGDMFFTDQEAFAMALMYYADVDVEEYFKSLVDLTGVTP